MSNTAHAYSSHIPQFAVLIAKMLHSLLLQWKAIQFSTVRLNHFFFCINVKLTRGLWIKQRFKTKITQDKSSNRTTLVAETTVEWVDGLPNNWSIMGPDCLRGEPVSHGRGQKMIVLGSFPRSSGLSAVFKTSCFSKLCPNSPLGRHRKVEKQSKPRRAGNGQPSFNAVSHIHACALTAII